MVCRALALECDAGGAPVDRRGPSVERVLGQAGAGVDVGEAGCLRHGDCHEFPGIPHRYCQNHFLRDVAQPVLDMDSRAKVKMRRKVRGLRAIERRVLEERRHAAAPAPTPADESPKTDEPPPASSDLGWTSTESPLAATSGATTGEARGADEGGEVVLGYCAAVRGILNDSQGGPLHPPGLRMSEALQDVRDSLERNLQAKKGGLPSHC